MTDELEQLIAEQEKEMRTGDQVHSFSLDAPISADGKATWGDLAVGFFEGVPRAAVQHEPRSRASVSDARHGTEPGYDLGCRCDKCKAAKREATLDRRRRGPPPTVSHGTLTMYAKYACRCDSCREAKSRHGRLAQIRKHRPQANAALLKQILKGIEAYIAGARIIDVATMLYEDAGYATPESCYQVLRKLFHELKVPVRPMRWQHGGCSVLATKEERRAYLKAYNRELRERRHADYVRCTAINNRDKNRCQRFAPKDIGLCEHHRREHPIQWTEEKIAAALLAWVEKHGEIPTARLWRASGDGPPSAKTLYNRCGNWAAALALAGLEARRARKSPASPREGRAPARTNPNESARRVA